MAFAGANKDTYTLMQNTVVDIGGSALSLTPNGQRIYLNAATFPGPIPSAWPTLSDPSARACVSIRPQLYELIQGNFDSQLQTFLMGAPGGPTSLLGLWHESSTQGPGGSYSSYYQSLDQNFPGQGGASGLLTKAQSYVQKKAHAWGANVKVGAIEVVETAQEGTLANKLDAWMAQNLDFYACDTYDFSDGSADPAGLLSAFQGVASNLAPGGAAIGVTETNSRFPGRRPYWFTAVWSWLQSNGYTSNSTCFLSFWNATGIESGAWIADDWATIDALYAIFAESSA